MQKKITCKQMQAILPFYIKGRVNPALCEIIEEHLANCPKCHELYLKTYEDEGDFAFLDAEIESIPDEIYYDDEERFATKEYANFKKKLSAYLDSELEDSENIKIKKMTISNPLARKDLEDMYLFKRLLHSSFLRTRDNCKYDFSKSIIHKITNENPPHADYILKIATFLLVVSAALSISLFLN